MFLDFPDLPLGLGHTGPVILKPLHKSALKTMQLCWMIWMAGSMLKKQEASPASPVFAVQLKVFSCIFCGNHHGPSTFFEAFNCRTCFAITAKGGSLGTYWEGSFSTCFSLREPMLCALRHPGGGCFNL